MEDIEAKHSTVINRIKSDEKYSNVLKLIEIGKTEKKCKFHKLIVNDHCPLVKQTGGSKNYLYKFNKYSNKNNNILDNVDVSYQKFHMKKI